MPQKRPTSVLVIAILHFVVASFGVCGLGLQLAGSGGNPVGGLGGGGDAQQKKVNEEVQKAFEEKAPEAKVVEQVSMGMSLLFTCLLIAGGVGLLQMRPWGRLLSLLYGFL